MRLVRRNTKFMAAVDAVASPRRACKGGCGRMIRWGGLVENTTQELGCYDCEAAARGDGRRIAVERSRRINPRQRGFRNPK